MVITSVFETDNGSSNLPGTILLALYTKVKMSSEFGDISWNERVEDYFASTGEKAHCLGWCHKRAEAIYSNRRSLIDLPVIVISAVTGFMSAGSTMMFDNPNISSVALGVASLFVSVLNTAGSYFGWAKRAEGHRIASIQYAKLYRFLSIEMALPREERMSPNDLLKLTRENYDRLQEISPLLPDEVITEFRRRFEKETEVSKPEELNGLERIVVFVDTLPQTRLASSPQPPPPSPAIGSEQVRRNPLLQYKAGKNSHDKTALTISLPTHTGTSSRDDLTMPLPSLPTPDTLPSSAVSPPS